jgi:deoxyribose-phosphate aldolase
MSFNNAQLSACIDHTMLKADAVDIEIGKLCAEARKYDFFGVCVHGSWVVYARHLLEGSNVKVISVAGFPLGAMSCDAKCFETESAVDKGAHEIDVVLNIGRLKQGDNDYVQNELSSVVKAACGRTVKVILETCLLNDEEKIRACSLAVESGAHFVKTSTGFSTRGATVADVKLMRATVGADFGLNPHFSPIR